MPAGSSTIESLDYALKEHYDKQRVESLTLDDKVLCDLVTKETMAGDVKPFPVLYSGPQGIANTSFATAQANRTTSDGEKWLVTVGDFYGVVEIGDKAIAAAEKDVGSFIKHKMTEMDELYKGLGTFLNLQMWSGGGSDLGQRGSLAGNVITLADRFDASNFEVSMKIVASANDGSDSAHSLRAGTAATVTAVDYENGTVTVDNAGSITGFADDDYLFREGSFGGGSQTSILKGVQSWIPASAPSSAPHFGVDRTKSSKLSGYRLPASAATGTVEEIIRKLVTEQHMQFGANPKKGFLFPRQWERLAQQLENNGYRDITVKNSTGTFGYDALRMKSVCGDIDIVSDRHCPTNDVFVADLTHTRLLSYNNLFHVVNRDGLHMLRAANSLDYECRVVAYPNLVIQKPGDWGRAPLPTVV